MKAQSQRRNKTMKKTEELLDDILNDSKTLRQEKVKLIEICLLLSQKYMPEADIDSFRRMLVAGNYNILIEYLK